MCYLQRHRSAESHYKITQTKSVVAIPGLWILNLTILFFQLTFPREFLGVLSLMVILMSNSFATDLTEKLQPQLFRMKMSCFAGFCPFEEQYHQFLDNECGIQQEGTVVSGRSPFLKFLKFFLGETPLQYTQWTGCNLPKLWGFLCAFSCELGWSSKWLWINLRTGIRRGSRKGLCWDLNTSSVGSMLYT